MILMYRTSEFDQAQIKRVEVERKTEKSVWVVSGLGFGRTRRSAITSSYEQYHDTWEDAIAHLKSKAKRRLVGAEESLARAKDILAQLDAMEKPANAS